MALTLSQGKKKKKKPSNLGGQFATLGTNVAAIKNSCFDEIYIVRSNKPSTKTPYFF
jgi:hypothetical protein